MAILRAQNIEIRFGGLIAVNNFSFEVNEGEILSIIGPNGAGKTTLFNALTGFVRPTKGKVFFNDQEITGFPPYRIAAIGIARTFQRRSFFPSLSVTENLFLGCHLRNTVSLWEALAKLPAQQREEKNRVLLEQILAKIGLKDKANVRASTLPYGEQRLLGIGIALAARPKILLLDEPCAGSNPAESNVIVRLIKDICREGITVILVEHHMRVVMSISDRVIVLNSGEKLAEGSPEEIQRNPLVVEAYLGRKIQNGSVA
ncbi:ABC transporter ATP-binding protein [Moorellaceae bacterium AZ2]